jgi:hypothetical protein
MDDDKVCWLAVLGHMEHGDPMPPCSGRLVRVHLIPKQLLKTKGNYEWDERSWVWACGGIMGNAGHHGMLDHSKRLRISRSVLPTAVEELATELNLAWWLDKTYGERTT